MSVRLNDSIFKWFVSVFVLENDCFLLVGDVNGMNVRGIVFLFDKVFSGFFYVCFYRFEEF